LEGVILSVDGTAKKQAVMSNVHQNAQNLFAQANAVI